MDTKTVYILLADPDGTMRSIDMPLGLAVTSKEEAERFVKEGGFGYSHSYDEITIFDNKDDALRHVYPDYKKQGIGMNNATLLKFEESLRKDSDMVNKRITKEGRLEVGRYFPGSWYYGEEGRYEYTDIGFPTEKEKAAWDIISKIEDYIKIR